MPQRFLDAIAAGDRPAVESLLRADPSLADTVTENGTSAVLLAAYHGNPEIARLLASHRAALTIFEAAAVGDLEQVRQLVEQHPERLDAFAPDGFQPLGLAAFFGHLEVVGFLLRRGAKVDSPSNNSMRVMPLHSAVAHRHVGIARELLLHGAPVDAAQQSGFTPLQGAVQNAQVEMIALLLEGGANPDLPGSDGRTPREQAEASGRPELVALLTSPAGG